MEFVGVVWSDGGVVERVYVGVIFGVFGVIVCCEYFFM